MPHEFNFEDIKKKKKEPETFSDKSGYLTKFDIDQEKDVKIKLRERSQSEEIPTL